MKKSYIIMMASVLMMSCSKETEFDINTMDQDQAALGNVEVKLFGSYEGWLAENSPAYTFTSDANGKINVTEKVTSGNYWIWAEKGDYSSWIGTTSSETVPKITVEKGEIVNFDVTLNENYHQYLAGEKWKLVDYVNSSGTSFWNAMGSCYQDDFLEFNRDMTFYFDGGDEVCTGWPQKQDLPIDIVKSASDKVEMQYFGPCYKLNSTIHTDPDGFSWNFYLQDESASTQYIIMSYDTTAVLNLIFEKAL
ncbi:carboxypeptidase-like regulatory domain-containing protein [Paracrocinitomix mangrovi]|uniref:carboxypeptidase-like regulatory domain-containing protein n=1 Tax=Paracrocinitomix mangrovi TaxID=2862509 RepID=UPI001C8D8B9A|nr:carboxypeptidase-like regulatory domain-containing protein [Paracrocinitomix mangrovi]UKN00653.1 carboxypeptidase-like regulatory domain-containing protein [Paracrocinitomix mangrovi]